MDLVFLSPAAWYLLLLLPGVWFLPRPLRSFKHGVVRSLLFLSLIAALAEPVNLRDAEAKHLVVLLDQTTSMATGIATQHLPPQTLQSLANDHTLHVITVGGDPMAPVADGVEHLHMKDDALGTPLGAALIQGMNLVPKDYPAALLLLSDLKSTDDRLDLATSQLTERGIPLHTLTVPTKDPRPRPHALHLREAARVGRIVRGTIEINGRGPVARMTIRDPRALLFETGPFEVHQSSNVPFEIEPASAGFQTMTISVEWPDGESCELTSVIPVQDPVRVLYVTHRSQGGDQVLRPLLGSGFDVRAMPAESLEKSHLADADVLFLDDCPSELLSSSLQESIIQSVQDRGLGLVMAGGGGGFGPGGYPETPLSELLPVLAVQKEEKKDPSTALALIIDTSGSMSGQRIIIAKEVARLAIRRLLPHDKVGIVEFYGNKRWAAPLQSAANAIAIQRALNRLDAGGGTVILPAIEEAYYGLKNTQTRYKHVLILTDAGVESGSFEPLMRKMARDGINVSTVLVGPERHSEFLVQLAQWGNGRYYNASDRFNLPEVILKQPSTSKLPAWRTGSHPVRARAGAAWIGEFATAEIPPVLGYVETELRESARSLLVVGEEEAPLLASWQVGLGRATVLMTEPFGAATDPWRDLAELGPLFARVLSRTSSEELQPFAFRLHREGTFAALTAERRGDHALEPSAHLHVPQEADRPLTFVRISPNLYEARFTCPAAEDLLVEAHAVDLPRPLTRLASPGNDLPSAELSAAEIRGEELSRTTRGREIANIADAQLTFSNATGPREGQRLGPLLLLMALLLYLTDLLIRRLPSYVSTENLR